MTPHQLASLIRVVPDFPSPGVSFRDLTPLLADGAALRATTEALAQLAGPFDMIAAIEARGFLFGAALAHATGKGLLLVRKPGKLPHRTIGHDYRLEYGSDRLEIHAEDITPGSHMLLLDDVLATGGTAAAAVTLLRKAGARVEKSVFVIELEGLGGKERLRAAGVEPLSLLSF